LSLGFGSSFIGMTRCILHYKIEENEKSCHPRVLPSQAEHKLYRGSISGFGVMIEIDSRLRHAGMTAVCGTVS
jgi:hypothetical protein